LKGLGGREQTVVFPPATVQIGHKEESHWNVISFGIALFLFLGLDSPGAVFKGNNLVRLGLAESFEVQVFNVFSQRPFPSLLTVVGITTELFWIQAEFPCHLYLGVGQVIPFAGVNPDLEFGEYLVFCHERNLLSRSCASMEIVATPPADRLSSDWRKL
jgi:hypothetical protein